MKRIHICRSTVKVNGQGPKSPVALLFPVNNFATMRGIQMKLCTIIYHHWMMCLEEDACATVKGQGQKLLAGGIW
jgi:hypothetical protein